MNRGDLEAGMSKYLKLSVLYIPAFSSSLANNSQIGIERGHFFVCEKKTK